MESSNYTRVQDNMGASVDNSETYEFKLYTPWKFGLSLGHTINNNIALGASYEFASYKGCDARIDDGVLHLGTNNGYYDLTAETGVMISQLRDFTVSVHYKVSSENELDGYGHFLFAFSALAENSAHEGPYMAMRLNEQRFETSTGGYEHEEIIMTGDKPRRDVWHHAIYRQQNHNGELFIDGKLIGRNDRMPILAEIFKDTPANCWIGRAPFRGDKYLTQTDVADFRIYTYAISDKDIRQLMKQAKWQ